MVKAKHILEFGIGLMLLVIVNQLVDRYPLRMDLTEEKKYSISPSTIQLLKSLQEPVFVEVYLEGDMPSGFKRLQKAVDETLNQFQYYSDKRVQYNFKDPSAASNTKARNEYFKSLMDRGLQPTNLSYTEEGNKMEKLIFPGAIISYYGKEIPVMMLKGNQAAPAEERLNQSIEGLEYEIASAIRQLASDRRKNIGLILGHGEPDSLNLAGLTDALAEKYNVFEVNLPNRKQDLSFYDAIIFPKPTTSFSETEQYKIDQYIMNGGKSLFFVDALRVNMDSVSGEGSFAFPYELDLDNMFFKYGVRINRNFVQDIVCGDYPVVAGQMGDQPQIRMLPWPFFPMVNNFGKHPIVRNLDAVSMRFVSTIDTVKADGIKKIPLMSTSQYSLISNSPVKVSFNELQKNLNPKRFNKGSQVVSYLLEGSFESVYKNRLLPDGVDKKGFRSDGQPTSILICADGDMIRNEFDLKTGEPMALGLSPFVQTKYANGEFVLNALEYMLNTEGIISAKNKVVKIRPLNKVKAAEEKTYWQVLNLGLPIVLLILAGILRTYWRKKKYANH